jgi:hypothetical protein
MKNFSLYLFLAASILTLLSGCSSDEKRAAEMMENGAFDEAESTYANIVSHDPKNAEAQAGLRSARIKILDTRLITVRKTRMAGGATALSLIDIITLENRWALQPPFIAWK